jgi:hypothetical protein
MLGFPRFLATQMRHLPGTPLLPERATGTVALRGLPRLSLRRRPGSAGFPGLKRDRGSLHRAALPACHAVALAKAGAAPCYEYQAESAKH